MTPQYYMLMEANYALQQEIERLKKLVAELEQQLPQSELNKSSLDRVAEKLLKNIAGE